MMKKIIFVMYFFFCLALNGVVIRKTKTPIVNNGNKINTIVSRSSNVNKLINTHNTQTHKVNVRRNIIKKDKTVNKSRAGVSIQKVVNNSNKIISYKSSYSVCRDAYFTCMDQFCVQEPYKRCVCSSKLGEIEGKEKIIRQTVEKLQDFRDLNLDSMSRTNQEVKSMLSATDGEKAIKEDRSDSMNKLYGISKVLNNSTSKPLSNNSTIIDNINSIWKENDFTSNSELINLTGISLYSAVHNQCSLFIANQCASNALFQMVISAYSMYIENDCTNLIGTLNKKITKTEGQIRQQESDMHKERLKNYNVHNSLTIGDCSKKIQEDLTNDSACGKGFIHCLDWTGLYINKTTGKPIYSQKLYQLKNQIVLNNNIIASKENKYIVDMLNKYKMFAKKTLDMCKDLNTDVWNNFLNQAIIYIKQRQDEIYKDVEADCLNVVSSCYDAKVKELKNFSEIDEMKLLKLRLNTSEAMCAEKLDTCKYIYFSNLEPPDENDIAKQDKLVGQMSDIKDQKLLSSCTSGLTAYLKQLCTPPSGSGQNYPLKCASFNPGNRIFALNKSKYVMEGIKHLEVASTLFSNLFSKDSQKTNCRIRYKQCNDNYIPVAYHKETKQIEPIDTNFLKTYGNDIELFNKIYNISDYNILCIPFSKTTEGKISYSTINDEKQKLLYYIFEVKPNIYNSICSNNAGIYTCSNNKLNFKVNDYHTAKFDKRDFSLSLYGLIVTYMMNNCTNLETETSNIKVQILEEINALTDNLNKEMLNEIEKQCIKFNGVWSNVVTVNDKGEVTSCDNENKNFYTNRNVSTKWGCCKLKKDDNLKDEKKE